MYVFANYNHNNEFKLGEKYENSFCANTDFKMCQAT